MSQKDTIHTVIHRFDRQVRVAAFRDYDKAKDFAVALAVEEDLGFTAEEAHEHLKGGRGLHTGDIQIDLQETELEKASYPHWNPESHWDEDPVYTAECWRAEVSDQSTRLSYKEWVNNEIQNKLDFPEPEES